MTANPEIIVVGLGPGRWDDLTLEARDVLTASPVVICRTFRHPTVDALREHYPAITLTSFDDFYESADSFHHLYPRMVETLIAAARQPERTQPVVYAVPGHPLIAEASVRELRRLAPAQLISVRLVGGLSFVEPVCAALDIDPLEHELQLVDATTLSDVPAKALMGTLLPNRPVMIAQAYNRRLASAVKLALTELYPDDWEIAIVRWASMGSAEAVERIPLIELDRDERADHLTTIYVPALGPLAAVRVPEGLRYITERLRAPDGCPWDREQTHQSLRKYVLEEAYEVAEVLDDWDGSAEMAEKLAEELGDLLLQVYLQAEMAEQEDLFHLGDVYQAIAEKLIRRHPHVFGDTVVHDSAHVLRNWDAIKQQERLDRGENVDATSKLHGIPRSAPALYQAYELGRKAAGAGFEWPDTEGVLAKIAEEARELAIAVQRGSKQDQSWELGDLLFVLTRLADRLGIQPEDALQSANRRFRSRFEAMEAQAHHEGRDLEKLTLDEWLTYWATAKSGD